MGDDTGFFIKFLTGRAQSHLPKVSEMETMTEDISYEMRRAGYKVRALNVPFNADHHELGQNQTMTFTGRTVQEARAKADAYLAAESARLKAEITQADRRISALEKDPSNVGSGVLYPELSCTVDRNKGTVDREDY